MRFVSLTATIGVLGLAVAAIGTGSATSDRTTQRAGSEQLAVIDEVKMGARLPEEGLLDVIELRRGGKIERAELTTPPGGTSVALLAAPKPGSYRIVAFSLDTFSGDPDERLNRCAASQRLGQSSTGTEQVILITRDHKRPCRIDVRTGTVEFMR